MDGGAHMLLDFTAPSAAVVNTDFRIGGGLAARLPDPADFVSLRLHGFHESTHLGDEYILLGAPSTDFRGYGGVRVINNDEFEGVDGEFAPRDSLFTTGDPELQVGGEVFFRGWRPADRRPNASWWSRLFAPQHFLVALDLYHRDRYDLREPEMVWSKNLVVGFIYGNHFEETSKPTVKWLLSFYDGVHPTGSSVPERPPTSPSTSSSISKHAGGVQSALAASQHAENPENARRRSHVLERVATYRNPRKDQLIRDFQEFGQPIPENCYIDIGPVGAGGG